MEENKKLKVVGLVFFLLMLLGYGVGYLVWGGYH